MILSFKNTGTKDIFSAEDTKAARKTCPAQVWAVAQRKLDMLNQSAVLTDLRVPPNNKLEQLTHDRVGQHAIRINDQYRLCFRWTDAGAEDVEITDYHYR